MRRASKVYGAVSPAASDGPAPRGRHVHRLQAALSLVESAGALETQAVGFGNLGLSQTFCVGARAPGAFEPVPPALGPTSPRQPRWPWEKGHCD